MSVVKSKRGKSKLEIITKSTELAKYTIKICSNEKNFPKRYRWCITNKIVDYAIDINNNIRRANSMFVKTNDDFVLRRNFQNTALSSTYALLSMIEIAYVTFGIDGDRIEYWTQLIVDIQGLLRNWRDSDYNRYVNI